eukprot:CAMPEP_0198143960 /NCGR_PEP_ID=MMETSP1443-20131203/12099_1 /TAXON_ID=186043 /ORGANISM="Entomoneis sp., Strain CCMP2396" /LENGTH=366 /DNA_ID=CAMNT_0043807271 /DNA_START=111 /DNA_END=1211 /DNA_ORIENTATION=+
MVVSNNEVDIRHVSAAAATTIASAVNKDVVGKAPLSARTTTGPGEASLVARYTAASIVVAIFTVWGKFTFVTDGVPGGTIPLHSWKVPVVMNIIYLISLPLLRVFSSEVLAKNVDVKSLLKEAMLVYNVGQVLLNGWMVYAFVKAVLFGGHPFIGGSKEMVETGVTYAVWVHYCDKYLEYMDTYFMVLRGRTDQVSFLHVYHHTTISLAWWIGLRIYPGGDAYFGALFNSFIHVMMYSYYALALLKINCPWKRFLTQAQLIQFTSVVLFSFVGMASPWIEKTWESYVAHLVQDFEMISLFVLFMAFYRKAYSNKKKSLSDGEDKEQKQIILSKVAMKKEDSDSIDTEQESLTSESSDEEQEDRKSK